ncbi:MAG: NUDIX hydrolase [Myxococcota bacterium]
MNQPAAEPRPAATTVLLRPGTPVDAFLIQRVATQRFMGGAHVFPGGRLDAEDEEVVTAELVDLEHAQTLAHQMGLSVKDALAFVVAAARELLEEAGVLVAAGATSDDARAVRQALLDGTSFREALRARSLVVDGNRFRYLAHWITPVVEAKRFSARFFVVPLPDGQEPEVDKQEASAGQWFTPRNAVSAHLEGQIVLPPPTLCVLDGLSRSTSFEEAVRGAQRPVQPILPEFHTLEDTPILAFPGDALHPEEHGVPGAPTRVELRGGIWTPRRVPRELLS